MTMLSDVKKSSQVDIKRYKAALRQAEAALAQALASCEEKERHFALRMGELAHEIKNPLNAIIGFSDIIRNEVNGPIGNPVYKNYGEMIHEAAINLLRVCELELDRASSEPGVIIPATDKEKRNIEIDKLLDQTLKQLNAMADKLGVKITTDISTDFPVLHTDPVRLQQILFNVISNAIKFTPEGGSVAVQALVDEDEGAMILVVQDTGVGMSPEELLQVLEPFHQVEGVDSRGDEGAGLGLSIATRLAQEIGAELDLRSQENLGTMVTLTFRE